MSKDLNDKDREAAARARSDFESLLAGAAGGDSPAASTDTDHDDTRHGREEDDHMAAPTAGVPPELQDVINGLSGKVDELKDELKAARKAGPKSDSEKELDEIKEDAAALVEAAAEALNLRDKQRQKAKRKEREQRARDLAAGLTGVRIVGDGKKAKAVDVDDDDDDTAGETGKGKKSGKEPKVVIVTPAEQALKHELDAKDKELKKLEKKSGKKAKKKGKKGKNEPGGIRGWFAGH
jgi:hypothetical protein